MKSNLIRSGTQLRSLTLLPILLLASMLLPAQVAALEPRAFSAGASLDDRAAHPEYPLKLVFAEAQNGAFIAFVSVIVKDAAGRIELFVEDAGPWVYLDVPPGRYTVEAIRQDLVRQTGTVQVGGWQRELILYWPSSG